MRTLNVKPAGSTTYDLVALGEVMLRFDPGDARTDSPLPVSCTCNRYEHPEY